MYHESLVGLFSVTLGPEIVPIYYTCSGKPTCIVAKSRTTYVHSLEDYRDNKLTASEFKT